MGTIQIHECISIVIELISRHNKTESYSLFFKIYVQFIYWVHSL